MCEHVYRALLLSSRMGSPESHMAVLRRLVQQPIIEDRTIGCVLLSGHPRCQSNWVTLWLVKEKTPCCCAVMHVGRTRQLHIATVWSQYFMMLSDDWLVAKVTQQIPADPAKEAP
jgi:hypothetical protein